MNRIDIERYKLEFEQWPDSWKSFGADLRDVGSPNPCDRAPIARKVLGGRWEEAYQDWLKAGEFSRDSEEMMIAFILATEVVYHRRAPAAIPTDLPKRIWSDMEYEKSLRHLRDVKYWNQCVTTLEDTRTTEFALRRNAFAKLLRDNKVTEAEIFYRDNEMDQDLMAEQEKALIETCAHAHGVKQDEDRASKTKWFYVTDAGQRSKFPISELELKEAFDTGKLLRTTQVWREGMSGWQPATFLKEFQAQEYSGAQPPALPAAQ